MPPVARTPQRPRKIRTCSRDRLRLSSGNGIFGLLFGLLFSTTGLLGLYVFGWLLLSILGVLPTGAARIAQDSVPNQLFALGGMLALGVAHLTAGTLLLLTLRVTFDRAHDAVVMRSGWLGLRRQKERLSHFQRVLVRPPEGRYPTRDVYDIVLEGKPRRLLVAKVTRSHALAREVAAEIAEFTGLATC